MASDSSRNILVTGGAGFIGSNLTQRLLRQPRTRIRIFDNLSRPGAAHNLEWLESIADQDKLEFVQGDVRDAAAVRAAAEDASEIYHLAAQVAVTSSIYDPRTDFEVNAMGTLNVLEAARASGLKPFFLFTSTNKVYGALDSLHVVAEGRRYRAKDSGFRGIDENEALDFHSPYGCSKGAADQYIRDYARIYDLPTVVFRMSCIAGPRQFGNEDQGWVAHFLYSALANLPVTVYGTGLQVRDVLHVSDLIDAMVAARAAGKRIYGQVYNVGGGAARAVSVSELLRMIEARTGEPMQVRSCEIRPGDQPLYVSNTSCIEAHSGWRPQYSVADTLGAIHEFWRKNQRQIGAVTRSAVSTRELAEEVA